MATRFNARFAGIVKHQFSETVIKGDPQKMVSLHPWITDFLLSMNITPVASPSSGPNGDGFSWYFQKRLSNTINLGWQIPTVNLEKVLTAKPELIIGTQSHGQVFEQLSKIAPTVYIDPVEDQNGIRRMRDTLLKLGDILDKQDQAKQAIAAYDQKVSAARGQLSKAIGKQSVMFLRVTDKELRYYGPKMFEVLYDDLGVTPPPLFPDTSATFQSLSLEKLPDVNPDYIFLLSESVDNTSNIQKTSLWKQLNAVKNNHVFVVDYDLWLQGFGPIANALIIDDVIAKATGAPQAAGTGK